MEHVEGLGNISSLPAATHFDTQACPLVITPVLPGYHPCVTWLSPLALRHASVSAGYHLRQLVITPSTDTQARTHADKFDSMERQATEREEQYALQSARPALRHSK